MSHLRRPKSDLGTILLHWLIVSALCGAVLTGLAIAALDNPDLRILPYVSFLLPGENVWYLHLGVRDRARCFVCSLCRLHQTDRSHGPHSL